jgi:hypothetical protein
MKDPVDAKLWACVPCLVIIGLILTSSSSLLLMGVGIAVMGVAAVLLLELAKARGDCGEGG